MPSEIEDGANHISPPAISTDDSPDNFLPENQSLRPGRLSIKCIGANDIQRRGQRYAVEKTEINPSLRFTLGSSSKPDQSTSRTHTNTDANPSFEDEIISFDVQNPRELFSDDGRDIRIKIELLNKNLLHFDVLGVVEISATRFFHSSSPRIKTFPIQLAGEWSTIHASISLELEFIPVKEGLLSVSLVEYDNSLLSKSQEPQIELLLGSENKYSDPIKARTSTSNKNDVMYIMVRKENWFKDLNLKLHAKGDGGRSELIGKQTIPLLPLIRDQFDADIDSGDGCKSQLTFLNTKDGKEIPVGNATVQLGFMQAGYLAMKDIRGSSFEKSTLLSNSGMQLILRSKGIASTVLEKSSILRYEFPGKDIIWSDQLILPLVDHHLLSIELYQLDALVGTTRSQDLVGSAEMSLLPMFKRGTHCTSVKLQCLNEVDARVTCGTLNFTLEFEGSGLSYPKLHHASSVVRVTREEEEGSRSTSPLAQEIVHKSKSSAVITSEVFSDDEIKSAFQFLDLDKNSHIGAAELRHALICSGALVTDEEIDAMISILDVNGDGQVNFQQFRMMGKSPNFGYESISTIEDSTSTNITSTSTQKDSETEDGYDAKRNVFSRFVANQKIHRDIIHKFREFLGQKRNAFLSEVDSDLPSSSIWEMDHSSLCRCLTVECTGESKKVFNLVLLNPDGDDDGDDDATQKIDVRQLLLGLINFIPTYSVHEKCQIMLEFYDVRKQGFLTFEDLKEVLAGNHMRANTSVANKAQTMMRFVDPAGTGKLTLEGLLDAASKFPNLLFPKHIQEDSSSR